jgi:hypothetical protein
LVSVLVNIRILQHIEHRRSVDLNAGYPPQHALPFPFAQLSGDDEAIAKYQNFMIYNGYLSGAVIFYVNET